MPTHASPPNKGEWDDGEFESFLADITPALDESVGRLGVAGSRGSQPYTVDNAKLIVLWPNPADRMIEELR